MKQGLILILLAIIVALLFLFWLIKGKSKKKHTDGAIIDIGAINSTQTYDLSRASETYILPKKLTEISGLSFFRENELYCVNDEKGKIFVYNLSQNEITDSLNFGIDADYEGIEIVGQTAYVMQSQGIITAIDLTNNTTTTLNCTRPEVAEYEGIAYDSEQNSLLLAAKEMQGDKAIYTYQLNNATLQVKYTIPSSLITANSEGQEFKPSGIAVHPISNELYILASAGKKLLVLDRNNNKKAQYNLDKALLKQPEGICFTPNGNLYISSEGKGGDGYILMFKPLAL
jgi:uncharacterized protein YjiK